MRNFRQLAWQIACVEIPLLRTCGNDGVRATIAFREGLRRREHLNDTVAAGVVAEQKATLIIGE